MPGELKNIKIFPSNNQQLSRIRILIMWRDVNSSLVSLFCRLPSPKVKINTIKFDRSQKKYLKYSHYQQFISNSFSTICLYSSKPPSNVRTVPPWTTHNSLQIILIKRSSWETKMTPPWKKAQSKSKLSCTIYTILASFSIFLL